MATPQETIAKIEANEQRFSDALDDSKTSYQTSNGNNRENIPAMQDRLDDEFDALYAQKASDARAIVSRGPWQTATSYARNNVVTSGGLAYLAPDPFISGATFAADLAAGKLVPYGGNDSKQVVFHATNVEPALDRAQPAQKLARLKTKIANIQATGSGVFGLVVFGDSIARSLLPYEFFREMFLRYGFRGLWCGPTGDDVSPFYSTSNLAGGGSSGTTVVSGRFSVSPTGDVFRLQPGNRVTFGAFAAAGVAGKRKVNKITIVHETGSGPGTFKVQTLRAGGAEMPQDYPGYAAVDVSPSTGAGVIEVSLAALEVDAQVSILGLTGNCYIVGGLVEDTTAAGMILSFVDRGGLDMENSNTIPQANLTALLNVLRPDACTWAMKDPDVGAKLAVHQLLWDNARVCDWLYLGTYPDVGAQTPEQIRAAQDPIIAHAVANNQDWFDVLPYWPTYQYGLDRGWYADTTHANATAQRALGPLVVRSMGILRGFSLKTDRIKDFAGITINGDDQASRNAKLRDAVMRANRGLTLAASSFGLVNSESAITPIGTSSASLCALVLVPATPATQGLVSMQNGTLGSIGVGVFGVSSNTGNGSLSVNAYDATSNTNYTLNSAEAYNAFWALAGRVVLVTLERNAAAAVGEPPVYLTINGQKFYPGGQGAVGFGPGLNFSATHFRLGTLSGNNSAQGLVVYGGARFDRALTDAERALILDDGDFGRIATSVVYWRFDEGKGNVAGRLPGARGRIVAGSWLRPNHQPARRALYATGEDAAPNERVVMDHTGGRHVIPLPAAPTLGQRLQLSGSGASGWRVSQKAGHRIVEGAGAVVGTNATTTGIGGNLSSTQRGDCAELECTVADAITPFYEWTIVAGRGTFTFV